MLVYILLIFSSRVSFEISFPNYENERSVCLLGITAVSYRDRLLPLSETGNEYARVRLSVFILYNETGLGDRLEFVVNVRKLLQD